MQNTADHVSNLKSPAFEPISRQLHPAARRCKRPHNS
jgi:hypothetical protein